MLTSGSGSVWLVGGTVRKAPQAMAAAMNTWTEIAQMRKCHRRWFLGAKGAGQAWGPGLGQRPRRPPASSPNPPCQGLQGRHGEARALPAGGSLTRA